MKRDVKSILLGISLIVLLVVVQKAFQINEYIFMRALLAVAAALFVGITLLSLYTRYYMEKMDKAAELLKTEQAKEYIEELEKLCQRAKGKSLKNVFQLNLSAGYCHLEEYEKAIEILEGLPVESLKASSYKVIRNVNLCGCYFATEQTEKAVELYGKSQEIFKPFRKSRVYGENIAMIDISVSIEKGQYDRAEKVLEYARKTWNNPKFQEVYRCMEAELEERSGAQDNL